MFEDEQLVQLEVEDGLEVRDQVRPAVDLGLGRDAADPSLPAAQRVSLAVLQKSLLAKLFLPELSAGSGGGKACQACLSLCSGVLCRRDAVQLEEQRGSLSVRASFCEADEQRAPGERGLPDRETEETPDRRLGGADREEHELRDRVRADEAAFGQLAGHRDRLVVQRAGVENVRQRFRVPQLAGVRVEEHQQLPEASHGHAVHREELQAVRGLARLELHGARRGLLAGQPEELQLVRLLHAL